MDSAQKPLELILARNLITSLSTPAFLVGDDGALLFYNEAAGSLLGVPFEDAGRMEADEWGSAFGPVDDNGDPVPIEELPLTVALRDGRPAHAHFRIRSARGDAARHRGQRLSDRRHGRGAVWSDGDLLAAQRRRARRPRRREVRCFRR